MHLNKNLSLLAVYFFIAVGLVSCDSVPVAMNSISLRTDVTNIRDIKLKQDNKASVYLRGKVTRQVPLVNWMVYQLQDSTGTIWVLTQKTELQLKDQVLIKGKMHYQSIPIAGKDFGEIYVEEQQQLERMPSR